MVLGYSRATRRALHPRPDARKLPPAGHVDAFDALGGSRPQPRLRQSPQRRARPPRHRGAVSSPPATSSPATITSRPTPAPRDAETRRGRSSARSNTCATPSSPLGPSATSTISTPSSSAGATTSPDRRRHPELPDRTVADVWAEEQPRLLQAPCPSLRDRPHPRRPLRKDPLRPLRPESLLDSPHPRPKAADPARRATCIRILDGQTELARHHRTYDTGRTVEDPDHLEGLLAATRQANAHTTRDRSSASPFPHPPHSSSARRARRTASPPRHQTARPTRRLREPQELAAAVTTALERDALGAGSIAHILETRRRHQGRKPPNSGSPSPTVPGVRDLDRRAPMTWRPTMPSDNTPPTTLTTDLRRASGSTAPPTTSTTASPTPARKRWSPTVTARTPRSPPSSKTGSAEASSAVSPAARLGRFKPLADWDWDWPTALERPVLERILSLDFLARGENVILVGAQGLGKTMLAKNIAHQAVLAGHSALFTTDRRPAPRPQRPGNCPRPRTPSPALHAARTALDRANSAISPTTPEPPTSSSSRQPPLRAPLPADHHQPPLQSTGTRVFPNASCAVALIDRLTHHVEILLIEGRSYRRREAEITQQQRSRQRRSRTRTPATGRQQTAK